MTVRGWKAAVVGALGVLVIVSAIGITMSVIETPVAEYPSVADARAAGAFKSGWLPTFLPPGATHVREAHSLDTNERWIAFTAPVPELRALTERFAPLAYGDARHASGDHPWRVGGDWPPELSKTFWHTPRSTHLLSYHHSKEAGYCLAVEWQTGRTWGWSCHRRRLPHHQELRI
jgi:hypothetical protein